MTVTISQFYTALMAVLSPLGPIQGVAFDDVTDKAKWRIVAPTATPAQLSAMQAAILGFDVNAAAATAANTKTAYLSDPSLQDLINRLKSATPAQVLTWVQNNSQADAGTERILAAILYVLGTML